MNNKKFLTSTIAAFLALMIFDYLWHGILLKDLYLQTTFLWRSKEESAELMPLMTSFYVVISITLTALYKYFAIPAGKDNLLTASIKGGFLMGMLVGIINANFYNYMPIPFALALAWFLGGLIPTTLIAYILFLINKNNSQ